MLLWVGRILMARMTLIRSTPFRSANRLHSLRKARIVARYEFSTIFVVSDSMGRSMTVRGNFSVFSTSRRNFSTRRRASSLQPEQTRQKSRIEATYSRPGITRSKLWASSGSPSMPRAAKAFFMIGQATNSVVPGATVVSINVRQCGLDLLADGPHRGLQGRHLRVAAPHVAQLALGVIALHVDHHAIGQAQAVAVVGGGERLLLADAARRSSDRPRDRRP